MHKENSVRKKSGVLTFYGLTPIHMGAGQSVSYVDNVIQRERHTSYPTLWSSGIKGVIRELASRVWNNNEKVNHIFGPENGSSEYASCISITDAKILLFPVRSVKGTFAWITCPFVLKRLMEDLKSIGKEFKNNQGNDVQIPTNVQNEKIVLCSSSDLKINQNQIALEEFVFEVENSNADWMSEFIHSLLPQTEFDIDFFKKHFAIVSDDVFKDFVNYAVEIRTRIRIDQTTGTVSEGALFSEELIPSESVFYSLVFVSDPYFGVKEEIIRELENKRKNQQTPNWDEVKSKIEGDEKKKDKIIHKLKGAWEDNYFSSSGVIEHMEKLFRIDGDNKILQLGADETLGKGFVKVKFEKVSEREQNHA